MSKRGPTDELKSARATKMSRDESQNVNTTEILFAAAGGDSEQVKLLYKLITNDVVFNANVRKNGLTPLMVAAAKTGDYQIQVINLLLNLGADCNAVNRAGETALVIAKKHNNQEAVKALYKYSSLEKSYFDWLPDSTISHISHFLPAYSFTGNNSVRQVCQYWNLDQTLTENKSIDEVVNACTKPEDVVAILKDEKIRQQLSFDQFISIVSFHPELAIKLILDKGHLLEGKDIAALVKHHESVAYAILDMPEFTTKSGEFSYLKGTAYLFGVAHLSIAEYLLDDPSVCNQLDDHQLSCLGKAHLSIAQRILDTPELNNELDGDKLAIIGNAHLLIANRILSTPELHSRLDNVGFAIIGETHLAVAQQIMNSPEFRERLTSYSLARLARAHISIADRIFDTPDLFDTLSNQDLLSFISSHSSIANRTIDTLEISPIFDVALLVRLGETYLSIAHKIMGTESLREQLQDFQLIKLGKCHLSIAQQIIDDPSLQKQLSINDWVALGRAHLSIAEIIISDANLCTLLDGENLALLGVAHLSIAEKILNDQILRVKLDRMNLLQLGKAHLSIARRLLDDEALFKQLGYVYPSRAQILPSLFNTFIRNNNASFDDLSHSLYCLSKAHVSIAHRLLDDKTLPADLLSKYFYYLGREHISIAHRIVSDENLYRLTNMNDRKELLYKNEMFMMIEELANYALALTKKQQAVDLPLASFSMRNVRKS